MIRDIQNIDDDIIRKKRIIGELLYNDPDIIEVLDNPNISLTSLSECVCSNSNTSPTEKTWSPTIFFLPAFLCIFFSII